MAAREEITHRHSRRRLLPRLLALLAVVAGGVLALRMLVASAPQDIARRYAADLPHLSLGEARGVLAEAPTLGPAGIELLVGAMADSRTEIAAGAADLLELQLYGWIDAPTVESDELQKVLVQQLAARLESFPPAAHERAVQMAETILQAPSRRRSTRSLETLLACDRILRSKMSTPSEVDSPSEIPATAQSAANPMRAAR